MAKKVKLVKNAPGDLGSGINSNLRDIKEHDSGTHTVRTKTHPHAEHIEKNRGLMHVANSGDWKAYNDTINTRIRKKIEGKFHGNINAPVAGRGGVFSGYHGNELASHFSGDEMEKRHQDPKYNKTVYYGKMSHPDKGYFEGVYKTEEHFPHKEEEEKKPAPKPTVVKRGNYPTPFDVR